jgi:hypothetical protein
MILEAFQRPMKGQLLRQGLSLDCGSASKTGSVPDFEVVVWWRGGAGASFLCRLAFFEFVEA